jgi:hypothetical protein
MSDAMDSYMKSMKDESNQFEDFFKWFRHQDFKKNDYIQFQQILNTYQDINQTTCFQNDELFNKINLENNYFGIFVENQISQDSIIDFTILHRIIAFVSFDDKEYSVIIKKYDNWYLLDSNFNKCITEKDAQDAFKKVVYIFIDKI